MDESPDILWQRIREAERRAPANRPHVLVVEDDRTARLLMRYALRGVVRTDAASTVDDALRMARSTPYDGLLVDIRLPGAPGTEVVEQLRQQAPYLSVPMVAVTAHPLPEDCEHFLEAGFDAYLAKPFEQDELRTLVRHLVVEGEAPSSDMDRAPQQQPTVPDESPDAGQSGADQGAPPTRSIPMPDDLSDEWHLPREPLSPPDIMDRSSSHSSTRRSSRGGRTGSGRRSRRGGGRSSGDGAASNWSRHGTALPGWTDLEQPKNRRRRGGDDDSFLERVSTVRFALVVLLLAGAFTLYVGHVHATKDVLNRLQEARSENQRLHLKRNRLKGAYDRKTSPKVIYERAREMGLEASVTYGPPITLDE